LATPAKTGGSTASAWRLSYDRLAGGLRNLMGEMILLTGLAPGMHYAHQRADQQIDQANEQHLKQQLAQEAAAQGWQVARFTHTRTTTSKDLASCRQLPQVTSDTNSIMGRQQLTLSCADTTAWKVKVTVETTIFVPAVYAQTVIERGDTISAGQL